MLLNLLMGFAVSARAENGFFDTTGGKTQEDTSKFGGIGVDEAIDQKTKQILDRFKEGRRSSNKDQKSRYSQILEHHDEDFDGVTDHLGANNALEGGMEKAALKGQKITDTLKRQTALSKAAEDAGRCQKGKVNGKDECRNISSILIDAGAAHSSDEKDEHRVYELTGEAVKNAQSAGTQYAEKSISAAGDYGSDAPPPNAQAIKNADGTVTSMRVTSGKETTVVKIAPNIDILKSEASYLEQLKDFQTKLQWKSMRAARLAGFESDKGIIAQFSGVLEKGVDDEGNLMEVARRIQEMGTLGAEDVCVDKQNNVTVPPQTGCAPTNKTMSLNEAYQDYALRNQLDGIRTQLRQKASKGQSPAAQKAQQQDVASIRKCLDRDAWCPGYSNVGRAAAAARKNGGKTPPITEPFKAISGDPGGTYTDTREFVMNRLDAANSGGLDNFMNVMKSSDFNESTDKKIKGDYKPYAQMKADWKAAKKAAAIAQCQNVSPSDYDRYKMCQNKNYKNPYAGNQFDTKTKNTAKLFGRNASRDGTSLLTQPVPTLGQPANLGGGSLGGGRNPSSGGPGPDRSGGTTNTMPAPVPSLNLNMQ